MPGFSDSGLQWWGAFAFGALMGWNLYFLNRYRTGVALSDLTSIIGALGGAAVLALFPAKSALFGAYGLGLALGFVLYFIVLVIMIAISKNFDVDWFLDGRRKKPADDQVIPAGTAETAHAMGGDDHVGVRT